VDKQISDLIQFKIESLSKESIQADLTINDQLPFFQGHFPNNPILPAVSIIDICLSLLSEVTPDLSYSSVDVKRCKFMGMVRPGQEISIQADKDSHEAWRLNWRLKKDQTKLAQIHLSVQTHS
jgi:3-hydroxymyristoyl/3-hydroxydecanoyl-(acyl carrier protein) dehydratase